MRSIEFINELFQPGKNWKWSFRGSEEAVAVFKVGDVPYMFHAYGTDGEWEAEFKQHGSKLSRTQKFGLTGTGNSAEVMSTVVDIMRAFLEKYRDKIQVLTFSAKEDSRQGLYARMVKRLLPNWTMTQKDEFFTLVAPNQDVAETWGIEKYDLFRDDQLNDELDENFADGDIDPTKLEILDHLKTMPLTVFGSTATKNLKDAKDFDVFLDLDAHPEHKKYINTVLNLSYRYYGWIDPFVIKDGVLYVRNDTATGWIRSKNAQAILKNIRAQGRPIDQITENLTSPEEITQ